MKRSLLTYAAGALLALPLGAAESLTSSPAFVFLEPEKSLLWSTGHGPSVLVSIPYTEGSASAALSVRGRKYQADYDGITTDSFVLPLPVAATMAEEEVYELTLTLDDGSVLTAKLGDVSGFTGTDTGATRCLGDRTAFTWHEALSRTPVVPILEGTSSLSVRGVETPTGLSGAGWFRLPKVYGGETCALALTAGGTQYADFLVGKTIGLVLGLR